jgi:hypothetical protein
VEGLQGALESLGVQRALEFQNELDVDAGQPEPLSDLVARKENVIQRIELLIASQRRPPGAVAGVGALASSDRP